MRYKVTCKVYLTDKRVGIVQRTFSTLVGAQDYYNNKARICKQAPARDLISWEVTINPI